MSILSESQITTRMTSTSPQRKNRSKCKNKARNIVNPETLPTNVLEEINRVLEGRQSPIGCNDDDITVDARNECVHDDSLPSLHHKWLDHSVKDLDLNSGKCLLCRCQHNPHKTSDANDSPQVSLWFCSDCKKIIEKEREANCSVTLKVTNTSDCSPLSPLNHALQSTLSTLSSTVSTTISSSTSIATQTTNSSSATTTTTTTISLTTTACSCAICKKHVNDSGQTQHELLRTCWHELKSAVLRIYRESGLVLNQTFMQQNRMDLSVHPKCPLPSNERLKEIVHKLCVHDRHKLYQCLEAQVRLFVVEMRLNLLKHLEHGSQALFEAMIDQYSKLCRASKKSAQFLQELESKHLRKFNLTWEFLNRRLFQSTVYCDTFIKHGLPKLTALTKDRSLIDMYARFLKFEDEMTVISVVWREAQQFIDKYEKYAILNKKRALLKEWEQLSVEWVLDDHASNTGKANSGENPMCIKKPSIECLNARFLEEQKLLKSGKNMQSVNLVVETQSALQEQMLLAAYGEWDANDIKTIPNLSQTNKQLKSATASTQVDLLLTSKTKCDGKVDDHEYDDCEDDDEDGDDEEDVEDEEDDDDDSCSDQSSTSTSTSNNQREGGRVCDCCYCEVFGHGMPAVAPTSRNYNEMRERLRLRLSKRKAEKCEKNGANSTSPETNVKSKENNELEDKRDLEELINFINGTDNNVKDKKKKEKQKKKKEKKSDLKDTKKEIKSEIKPMITSNSNSKTAETTKNHKIDKTNNDHHSKEINGSNHCHLNSLKSINNKEQQQKHDYLDESRVDIASIIDVNHITNLSSNGTTIHNVTNGNSTRSNNNNNNTISNNNNNNKNGNNKKKIKTCNEKKFENHVMSQNLAHVQNNSESNHKVNEEPVCNGVLQHSSYKANGNLTSQQIQQQLLSSLASPERLNSEMRHNNNKSKQNKVNKTKKKNNSDETLSPDEVFMPKDIDLDNGELDEFEKELEAFKRFCFNSKPLARKEKVNVNLKDIILKKRND